MDRKAALGVGCGAEDSSIAEVYPRKLFLVYKNIYAKKSRKEGSERL